MKVKGEENTIDSLTFMHT